MSESLNFLIQVIACLVVIAHQTGPTICKISQCPTRVIKNSLRSRLAPIGLSINMKSFEPTRMCLVLCFHQPAHCITETFAPCFVVNRILFIFILYRVAGKIHRMKNTVMKKVVRELMKQRACIIGLKWNLNRASTRKRSSPFFHHASCNSIAELTKKVSLKRAVVLPKRLTQWVIFSIGQKTTVVNHVSYLLHGAI